jgi:hypothetical protein
MSLFPFYKSSGSKYLIATTANGIYDVTSGTPAAIKTGLNANGARFSAATYYDKLYMLNGNSLDGLMTWDGTTFSTVAGAPAGQYVVLHKNRLYIAGDPNNPSRLYMSDLGTPTSWPTLNFIDVNTNDGDKITGLAELQDTLVIFKERSIHVLRGTGPQNYSLLDTHQARGTVSHWTIAPVLNQLFFLARVGVYSFDGRGVHLQSDVIKGSVLGLNSNQAWNQQYLQNACAVEYKNKYWLSVTEGVSVATNNRIYIFDYEHSLWTRYDIPANCFSLFQPSSATTYNMYFGNVTSGLVYQHGVGNSDDGAAINAYFQTKDFEFGAPAHMKSYKGLFFAAVSQLQNYAINISYILDRGRHTRTTQLNLGGSNASLWGSFVWGQSPWGSIPNVAAKTTAVAGQSRYLSFKVSDNSTNPWTFLGWIIRYKVKRRLS